MRGSSIQNGKAIAKFSRGKFQVIQRYLDTWEVRRYRRLVARVYLANGYGYQVFLADRKHTCLVPMIGSLHGALDALGEAVR
jgi:hypothetical protein